MSNYKNIFIQIVIFTMMLIDGVILFSQADKNASITWQNQEYTLYPQTIPSNPEVPSPYTTEDGVELVVVRTKAGDYGIVPVTLENSDRKGQQLQVDSLDFPTLVRLGLHSEIILDQTRQITGRSIVKITELGHPGGLSTDGFLAGDEDIISVLRGDNRRVLQMGLTHPQLARPLFQVWNLILTDLDRERWNMAKHRWENVQSLRYHDKTVLLEAHDTKGGQESIFDDGAQGAFYIKIWRELEKDELKLLQQKYSHLSKSQFETLVKKLTQIETGEMEPYYIMRYGFYEGHTAWRTDPVTIVFIFGLKSLAEIEGQFDGKMDRVLTAHFVRNKRQNDYGAE